ncbi:16S rRNA (uracil(1498)-N(3))-methyltransferase [Halobacillus sp. Marseille-Q1614]|uniref:16S rRNA (uracil(1498)-N(3))-methyltransferase n=1 Tax=Halobacillus sp. Marseille-Q1614 TaxID=2709134 RepID=UPI00157023A9|nr:16S rRNA (uracil(1498)-N(3))-methyltransferase [Halobacillus sp. Marseille-Q1614]
MQRYFVKEDHWDESLVYIEGEDFHHITNVMRMKVDDFLICIHPEKGAAKCKIEEVLDKEKVVCSVLEWLKEDIELPVAVSIVQSLGKGDKLEQVVQKGTELGADSFVPFQADRSVAKWDGKKAMKKIRRLAKIAKEASEQSERTKIPEVHPLMALSDVLEYASSFNTKLFAFEEEARKGTHHTLKGQLEGISEGSSVIIAFGPEGGFSEKEAETLKSEGFNPVRLGRRILRMETAPLYFLSAVSYEMEERR